MEPQIEYARAADGVRIATMAFGEGPPLLTSSTPPWSHVELETRIPSVRSFLEALAETHRVVRYDCRGTGLSDRQLDFSLDAQVRDLAAVADHYELDRFAIYGSIGGGPATIAYAARHPERVSHLVLWSAFTRGPVLLRQLGGLREMMQSQWDNFVDTFAHLAFGWGDSDTGEHYARMTRAAITQEGMIKLIEQLGDYDVSEEARAVRAPTLIIMRREVKFGVPEMSRELAGLIPGARLLVLEGAAPAPFLGDVDAVVRAFREFLATSEEPRAQKPPVVPLTSRETQVLRLLAGGSTSKEIAAELGISTSTAQRHIANIYSKVGARGRVEAAAYAFAQGLMRPSE